MQEQMLGLKGSRSYSTSATLRRQGLSGSASTQEDPSIAIVANMIAQVSREVEERPPGLKFDMPTTPLPKTENMRRRYDPLVEQFTKLLMRHGKLSVAQKVRGGISEYFTHSCQYMALSDI
jgi:hypothetical protein